MIKITSFTHHTTAEGERLTFTSSEIDENGNLVSSNNRSTIIVLDDDIKGKIADINEFLIGKIQ